MTRVLSFMTALALAGYAGSAFAQPILTLDEAVGEALAHNRPLTTARTSVSEADARVQETRAGRLPRLNISEGWQRGNQPGFVFSSLLSARQFAASNFAIEALNHPAAVGFFHTAVGVDQLLWDGGRLQAALQAATLQRDMSDAGVAETEAATRLAVTQQYGRLLALTSARRALTSALETAEADVARVRQRRDAGMATEADVLSLAVHASDVRQRIIQAEGDLVIARADLNRLLGRAIDRTFEVVSPVPPPAAALPDVTTALATAETNRPELRRAALAEALTATVQRQARAALLPQVGAQAGVDIAGTTFTDRASSWIVGGEVRWTLSAGGAERARLNAAAAAAARARSDREEARAQVQVDVVSATQRLAAARARSEVGRATVEQARESQRIIRDRFDAGMAGVTDVLRAASALIDAEAQHTAAFVDALVSAAALDKAMGARGAAR